MFISRLRFYFISCPSKTVYKPTHVYITSVYAGFPEELYINQDMCTSQVFMLVFSTALYKLTHVYVTGISALVPMELHFSHHICALQVSMLVSQ